MMQKNFKMTETLANGYSYESAQRELSNEYQHDRIQMVFIFFSSYALDESSLSIGRVKTLLCQTLQHHHTMWLKIKCAIACNVLDPKTMGATPFAHIQSNQITCPSWDVSGKKLVMNVKLIPEMWVTSGSLVQPLT